MSDDLIERIKQLETQNQQLRAALLNGLALLPPKKVPLLRPETCGHKHSKEPTTAHRTTRNQHLT